MDFQVTYSQMVNLCQAPSEVYKITKFRKQIKNQWARDDPAFIVIQILFLVLASLAFSISFGVMNWTHFIRVVAGSVLIEFLGAGCVIATAMWWYANKYLNVQRILSTKQEVEWLYAFDIHCNSFFPMFVLLYVVQYFLSPLILSTDFVATLVANTLYGFAFAYYNYVTFLGYSALPFLQNTQRFLHPIGLIGLLYFFSLLLNWNVSRFVLNLYFGK